MKLATMVLSKEITFDQGLVRAYTNDSLEPFIEGLNLLAQGKYFDIASARERLQSGNALRAIEGRIPPFALPPELASWSIESLGRTFDSIHSADATTEAESGQRQTETTGKSSPDASDQVPLEKAVKELQNLEKQIQNLYAQRREYRELLNLLQLFEKNRPSSPKPWVGGLILMGWTLFLAIPVSLFIDSRVGVIVFIVAGLLVSSWVIRRELIWNQHVLSSERVLAEHRKVNIEVQKTNISNIEQEIRSVQEEASNLVEPFSESDRQHLVNSFPDLFVKFHPASKEYT